MERHSFLIRAKALFVAGVIGCGLALPLVSQAQGEPGSNTRDNYFASFWTWNAMRAELDRLKSQYPQLVHERVIGKTTEGRDIPVFRISDDADIAEEPEVLIMSGIHPREQQPNMVTMQLVADLLHGYGHDPVLTKLVKERQIWILPMFNIDGKVFDMARWTGGSDKAASWRKNRAKVPVDLNRNFSVLWGGASDDPKNVLYQGAAPMSEQETQVLAAFIESRRLSGFMDIHSYMRLILPSLAASPTEASRMTRLQKAMLAAQAKPYGTNSKKIQQTALVGQAAANEDDGNDPDKGTGNPAWGFEFTGLAYSWAYYTQGAYSVIFEVYPKTFYPSADEIKDEYANNVRGALLAFIDEAGKLPARHKDPGNAVLVNAELQGALKPGATVSWLPQLKGDVEWATLVSSSKDVRVIWQHRVFPAQQGYKLLVMPDAQAGTKVPLTLYVFDSQRRRTIIQHELTIE